MPYRTEINGDVTDFDCDAIVNSLGINGAVYGKICQNVIKKANSPELKTKIDGLKNQKVGTIYVTKGFDLPAKNIIHIVTPFKIDEEDIDNDNLVDAYRSVIAKAIELKYKSIALPFLGTGANGYTKNDAYNAAMKAIGEILLQEEKEDRDIIDMILMVYFPKHRKSYEQREREDRERRILKDRLLYEKPIVKDYKVKKTAKDYRVNKDYSLTVHECKCVNDTSNNVHFQSLNKSINKLDYKTIFNRFETLVKINGPYTFDKLQKIPTVDVFKKYRFDYDFNDNQDYFVKMAKIQRLYNLLDPDDMFIPKYKYSFPYGFLMEYFDEINFDTSKLTMVGMDRRVKHNLEYGLKTLNKKDVYIIIHDGELPPIIAVQFMHMAGFTFSPYDKLDMFMVDYLLGVYGILDNNMKFSEKAQDYTGDCELKLYFEKYNETGSKKPAKVKKS